MFSIFDLPVVTFTLIIFMIPALVLLVLRRSARWRSVANGLLITLTVVFLLLSAGELYLRYVLATTDSGFRVANGNWVTRYWQQNALGFRDREWTPAVLAG